MKINWKQTNQVLQGEPRVLGPKVKNERHDVDKQTRTAKQKERGTWKVVGLELQKWM